MFYSKYFIFLQHSSTLPMLFFDNVLLSSLEGLRTITSILLIFLFTGKKFLNFYILSIFLLISEKKISSFCKFWCFCLPSLLTFRWYFASLIIYPCIISLFPFSSLSLNRHVSLANFVIYHLIHLPFKSSLYCNNTFIK